MPIFAAGNFDPKVGQTDLFLDCDESSLTGLCMHKYKFLCAAVTICATLINKHRQTDMHTHTHTHTHISTLILVLVYEKLS